MERTVQRRLGVGKLGLRCWIVTMK